MLYRILIVDDENYIADSTAARLGMSGLCEMDVAVAYGGPEALARASRGRLDLLITDIRMPDMDGIELSRAVRSQWPMCQTILLTAHAEFDYAYQAMKQASVEYVLKHEGFDAVLAACARAIERIGSAISREEIYAKAREQARSSMPWMRRELLLDLAHGIAYDDVLVHRAQAQLDIEVDLMRPMAVAMAFLHDVPADDTLYDRLSRAGAIELAVRQCLPSNLRMAQSFIDGKRLLWLMQGDEALAKAALEGWLESMQEALQAQLDIHASISFAVYLADYHDLREAYDRLSAVHGARCVGSSRMMWLICLDDEPDAGFRSDGYAALARAWHRACLSDNEAADALFSRLMDALLTLDTTGTLRYMQLYMSISMQIAALLNDMRLGEDQMMALMAQKLYEPQSHATPGEAASYLTEVVSGARHAHKQAAADMESSMIAHVRAYIREHLTDASLDGAAQYLHINASYLSRAYRQATGETLTETITAIKMGRACELLDRPGIKIQDVASALGFSAPAYFSFFFKKNMGVTPREYRERLANSQKN